MHAQDMLVRELRAAYEARSRDARRFWAAVAVLGVLGLGIALASPTVAGTSFSISEFFSTDD